MKKLKHHEPFSDRKVNALNPFYKDILYIVQASGRFDAVILMDMQSRVG
jgi:hypothetical protein